MKKFIISVLFTVVFFMGLGGLFQKTSANFKSDERALALIRQAREAIGGDANINNVRSLTIIGRATKTFEMNGVANSEQGDLEINMQLPNQLSKSLKITRGTGTGEPEKIVESDVDVIVMKKGDAPETIVKDGANGEKSKVIIMKKDGGEPITVDGAKSGVVVLKKDDGDGEATFTTKDGKKMIISKDVHVIGSGGGGFPRHNELFRTTFSLLLSAPEGLDVSYIYGGEGSVDGNSCDIVVAQTGGASYKLYLDKSSHLPRMMTYQGVKPVIFKFKKADGVKADAEKDVKIFTEKVPAPETAEFQVKFSDYRNVGGVQFPYRWEQTVSGKADETVDVTSYEINPANINEKFNKDGQKIYIRTKKPE